MRTIKDLVEDIEAVDHVIDNLEACYEKDTINYLAWHATYKGLKARRRVLTTHLNYMIARATK